MSILIINIYKIHHILKILKILKRMRVGRLEHLPPLSFNIHKIGKFNYIGNLLKIGLPPAMKETTFIPIKGF